MYHETIPTAQLVYRVALVMQEYTQSGGVSIVMRVISGWNSQPDLKSCVHFVSQPLLFRWGHLESLYWSVDGMSLASRSCSRYFWDIVMNWFVIMVNIFSSATPVAPTLPGRRPRWARTASMARLSWRRGEIRVVIFVQLTIHMILFYEGMSDPLSQVLRGLGARGCCAHCYSHPQGGLPSQFLALCDWPCDCRRASRVRWRRTTSRLGSATVMDSADLHLRQEAITLLQAPEENSIYLQEVKDYLANIQ